MDPPPVYKVPRGRNDLLPICQTGGTEKAWEEEHVRRGHRMLEHTECPRCHAPNLKAEVICFACGAALRAPAAGSRGRFRVAPAEVPWVLWVGLVVGLVVAGFVGWMAANWLAGYRLLLAVPKWYFPTAGVALIGAGQIAFAEARRIDRRWWGLRRAPQLPLVQVDVGDTVWVRGKLQCDTPLIAPYTSQACAYYRYVLQEREEGHAGWQTRERETRSVDFSVLEDDKSVYVPCGGVLFDAQLYTGSFLDASATSRALVWALPVGLPVSVCGNVGGEADRPRMDAVGEDLPAVATWRAPADYVALTGRRAKLAQIAGWALTVLGALALVASAARV